MPGASKLISGAACVITWLWAYDPSRHLRACLRRAAAVSAPTTSTYVSMHIPSLVVYRCAAITKKGVDAEHLAAPGAVNAGRSITAWALSCVQPSWMRDAVSVIGRAIPWWVNATRAAWSLWSIATLATRWREHMHEKIGLALQAQVYFAKPHSPWQRGLNQTPTACCVSTFQRVRASVI